MKEVAEADIPVDAPAAPPVMDVEADLTDASLLPSQRDKGYLPTCTYICSYEFVPHVTCAKVVETI